MHRFQAMMRTNLVSKKKKNHRVHLCKFKPTVKIYVVTSPGSMCSLICNTVRWHMDVSREGEPRWPVAQLPPSLSLSLSFCLWRSLSSSFPVLPSPFNSPLPLLLSPSTPPSLRFQSYLLLNERGGRCCEVYWWRRRDLDVPFLRRRWKEEMESEQAASLCHMVCFPNNIH